MGASSSKRTWAIKFKISNSHTQELSVSFLENGRELLNSFTVPKDHFHILMCDTDNTINHSLLKKAIEECGVYGVLFETDWNTEKISQFSRELEKCQIVEHKRRCFFLDKDLLPSLDSFERVQMIRS